MGRVRRSCSPPCAGRSGGTRSSSRPRIDPSARYNSCMSRRRFLKASAVIGAGVATGAFRSAAALAQPRRAAARPIRILLAGYAPPNNGFSLSLKRIGERIQTKFGKDVDVKYLFNILDLGYKGEDLPWLVEDGVLTVAYQSSSYFTEQIPDLGIADLPFLFSDTTTARAAMDGRF